MIEAHEFYRNLSMPGSRDDDRRNQSEVADMLQAKIDQLERLVAVKDKQIEGLRWRLDESEAELKALRERQQ